MSSSSTQSVDDIEKQLENRNNLEHTESGFVREGTDVDLIYDDPAVDAQLQKIESHRDPAQTDINEKDPYKYFIDKETGLRLVEFLEVDKDDPRQWPKWRKWCYTMVLGMVCFMVALASAIVTGDIRGPAEHFHVSQEVVILTVTLFVIGFGVGPLVFAPASEQVGRQLVYLSTLFVAVIFVLPCALAKNIGTLLVCRLIDGIAFSAPMTVIGGSLADMWVNEERGVAMAIFSAAPFLGPVCGPLIGGFISDYAPSWRWIYWVTLIFSGFVYAVLVITVPETHHTTILRRRAKKLIKITGDNRYKVPADLVRQPLSQIMKVTLFRPFQLITELIVALVTLYMTVIYGLLYMFFFAFPVVFGEGKGWSDHRVGLAFIPVAVGVLVGTALAPFVNKDYQRRCEKYRARGEVPPPELRLIPMMISCWGPPVGLFIFAWTSWPNVSAWGPMIAGFPCGAGFIFLYNSANNYIVDSYQHYAASALAAKTCVRSFWGAGCVLFTIQMYHRLDDRWASTLLAFIALACCAIPYLFFFYGAKIRSKSKYAYAG